MGDLNSVEGVDAPHKNPRAELAGRNPRERGREKRRQVLEWLYRWHKTSGPLVQRLLGTTQRDYLSRLEKQGLVLSVAAPGLPIGKVWMLTRDGVALAVELTGQLFDYDTSPASIDYKDLRHDLVVQKVVQDYPQWIALPDRPLREIIPERLLGADRAGHKRPDALIVFGQEGGYPEAHAIEVELTPKKGRELDQALLAAAQMLKREEVCAVEYFSQSQALLDSYRAVLEQPLNVWAKNERSKKWEASRRVELPPYMADDFLWHYMPGLLAGLSPQ